MRSEIVRSWMTQPVVTIPQYASLPEAHEVMREYNIRRLPVVNERGQIVGILSQGDMLEAQPSDATSLSVYELRYLLTQLPIKQIMSSPVYTVTPETSIAQAAQLMLEKKIGGLPVVSAEGTLIGMITESDIFRLVVQRYAAPEAF
jgi:acetoin utilization protein AcuB